MEENLLKVLEYVYNEQILEKDKIDNQIKYASGEEVEEKFQDEQIKRLLIDKKQLEEEINSENLDYIKKEYKQDLEKVDLEIKEWEKKKQDELEKAKQKAEEISIDKDTVLQFIESKKQYEDSISKIKEEKEALEKNQKEAEDELNKLTNNGKKTFIEKPIDVRECEGDIKNIKEKLLLLKREETREKNKYEKLEKTFKEIYEKYDVEKIMQKLKENQQKEELELKESQEPEEKTESKESQEPEEKKESEESQKTEEKTGPEESQEQKYKTTKSEQKPEQKKLTLEQIRKAQKQEQEKRLEQEEQKKSEEEQEKKEDESLKIIIGNTGSITYKGKQYKIDTKTIKNGLKQSELNWYIEIPETVKDLLKHLNIEEKTPIDATVLLAINNMGGLEESKKNRLMAGYIFNVAKSQYERKVSEGEEITEIDEQLKKYEREPINIIYDINDLSKPIPFWKTLFSRNISEKYLTGKEKENLVRIANKSARYGVAKTIGQYKKPEGIKNIILKLFHRGRKMLPMQEYMQTIDMTDENTIKETTKTQQIAAEHYDNAINKTYGYDEIEQNGLKYHKVNKTKDKREEFLESLHTEVKGENKNVKKEVESLKNTSRDITR